MGNSKNSTIFAFLVSNISPAFHIILLAFLTINNSPGKKIIDLKKEWQRPWRANIARQWESMILIQINWFIYKIYRVIQKPIQTKQAKKTKRIERLRTQIMQDFQFHFSSRSYVEGSVGYCSYLMNVKLFKLTVCKHFLSTLIKMEDGGAEEIRRGEEYFDMLESWEEEWQGKIIINKILASPQKISFSPTPPMI